MSRYHRDIWIEIFIRVEVRTLRSVMCCCKYFASILSNEHYWRRKCDIESVTILPGYSARQCFIMGYRVRDMLFLDDPISAISFYFGVTGFIRGIPNNTKQIIPNKNKYCSDITSVCELSFWDTKALCIKTNSGKIYIKELLGNRIIEVVGSGIPIERSIVNIKHYVGFSIVLDDGSFLYMEGEVRNRSYHVVFKVSPPFIRNVACTFIDEGEDQVWICTYEGNIYQIFVDITGTTVTELILHDTKPLLICEDFLILCQDNNYGCTLFFPYICMIPYIAQSTPRTMTTHFIHNIDPILIRERIVDAHTVAKPIHLNCNYSDIVKVYEVDKCVMLLTNRGICYYYNMTTSSFTVSHVCDKFDRNTSISVLTVNSMKRFVITCCGKMYISRSNIPQNDHFDYVRNGVISITSDCNSALLSPVRSYC